jgi:glycosyltransferase involved in cell wall biosynthesis
MRTDVSEPTFSVLVPAFNAERTIGSAVGSVLAQTREDFEVIVVDDGSSDRTSEHALAFGDPRVTVHRQHNAGLGGALNACLSLARGGYLCRLDADDLYLPTYLEEMERTLESAPDAGFAYTDAWLLDERTRRIARFTAMASQRPPVPPPASAAQFLAELLERNFVFVATTMRRSALEHVGPFNASLMHSHDYEMWLRFAALGYRAVRTPNLLAVYRRSETSISSNVLDIATDAREIYRRIAEDEAVPAPGRRQARRRYVDSAASLAAAGRIAQRRPWVSRLRRPLGRWYARARSRDAWYSTPPPEVAGAIPDLGLV